MFLALKFGSDNLSQFIGLKFGGFKNIRPLITGTVPLIIFQQKLW